MQTPDTARTTGQGKSAGSGKMSPAALGSARLTVKRCSAGEAEWVYGVGEETGG